MSGTTNDSSRLTIGSGSDSLTLLVNQDAYLGDAQYVVRVDGMKIGNVLTASALRSSGQVDTVTVLGDWAAGAHTVEVEFLNDAWGGTPETDRNLYVVGASHDGRDIGGATASLFSPETASFSFSDGGPALPLTIGSGSDSLTLLVNQDAYLGDAQYVVRVDGAQVGGVLTASALRSSGQVDTVTVRGDWGGGGHTVEVEFLNDACGGSAATDRNLYLVGASHAGVDLGASASLLRPGTASFAFADGVRSDTLRILPLGDSNTHGWDNSKDEAVWEGYRKPLWDLATGGGLSIDFVGSRSNGSAGLPDRDHFGVSGITATEVATFAGDLARETRPDAVLLLLGTNDALREGDAAQTVPGELLSIMRSIASVTPDVDILLASLPPIDAERLPFRSDANTIRDAINAQLPGVVAGARAEGIDATFVPVSYAMDDLTDGVHLSEAAHARVAQAWYDALVVG